MIEWIKSLFEPAKETKVIDLSEYPYYENLRSARALGYYNTYTIKVVWSDGSEDMMDCEDYRLDEHNNLILEFMEEPKAKVSGSTPFLSIPTMPKRSIDDNDRRYWELVDSESHVIEKQVEFGEKITWSDYNGMETERTAIKSEEEGYEEVEQK